MGYLTRVDRQPSSGLDIERGMGFDPCDETRTKQSGHRVIPLFGPFYSFGFGRLSEFAIVFPPVVGFSQ
jgi:hypothetical protein